MKAPRPWTADQRTRSRRLFRLAGGEESARLRRLDGGEYPADRPEAIRHPLEQIQLHCDGRRLPISVSIGATREPGPSCDGMLAPAGRVVDQAKQQGRNRVVIL